MSRSCATPVIFHYLDRLAGRAAQDKQLRTHSKSWDCSDMLHGVAARKAHTGGEQGLRVCMCDSIEAGGSATELSATGAWHRTAAGLALV